MEKLYLALRPTWLKRLINLRFFLALVDVGEEKKSKTDLDI